MRGNSTHKGFTLAEVLVTLGIIGVVSAMTIPSLTQNWQKKSYVTQLHKVYNVFQQAFWEEINEKQALNLTEAGLTCGAGSNGKEFLHEHFKVVKDCGMNNSSGCFATSYRSINGRTTNNQTFWGYNVSIAGGASIAFDNGWGWAGMNPDTGTLGIIYVDTNGPKGPNISGRDLFVMAVYPDGSLDELNVPVNCRKNGTNCGSGGSATATRNNYFNNYCKNQTSGYYCFGKILNDNWEMNY